MVTGHQRHRPRAEIRRSVDRCTGRLCPAQNALQPFRPVGCEGRAGRCLPCSCIGRRPPAQADRHFGGEGAPPRICRQRGSIIRPPPDQVRGPDRAAENRKNPRADKRRLSSHRHHADRWPSRRLHAGELLLELMPKASILHADKGYVRQRRDPSPGQGQGRDAEHPPRQSPLEELFLAVSLLQPQRHRTYVRLVS